VETAEHSVSQRRSTLPSGPLLAWALAALAICPAAKPQSTPQIPPPPPGHSLPGQDPGAEFDLRTGIDLSSKGLFAEAIPHLAAAQGHVRDEYAADFNLALCHIGLGQFHRAIQILETLRSTRPADANVENLLAQAYIGDQQPDRGFAALQIASQLTPKDEKLYLYISDACTDRQDYDLGIRVIDLGLRQLPDSARLHYLRGYFLSLLDQFDSAKTDFDLAVKLAPHTEIAFVAAAQKALFAGALQEAISVARAAIRENHPNYLILTILGEALIRSGASPGQREFEEASRALQQSVAARPGYASSQIALGYLLLLDNQPAAAVEHLEIGRRLNPRNPAVYTPLAVAYRKLGRKHEAGAALVTLAQLNEDQAARINSAPGDHQAIRGGAEHSINP
jgi:tetratricopeptide (TPR) repeat protein